MAGDPTVNGQFGRLPLRELILESLKESEFPFYNGKDFLPCDSFESLLTKDNISQELSGASHELIGFIYDNARRTFATILIVIPGFSGSALTSIMESFQRHGFDDSFLPIDGGKLVSCHSPHDCEGHATALNIFHDKSLRDHIYNFSIFQGIFIVPRFPLPKDCRRLHPGCVLPFTEFDIYSSKEDTFSKVHKAKLRVDHQQTIPRENESLEIQVAIKKFKRKEDIDLPESEKPDVEAAWSREADALEELSADESDKTHNIARGIGSFSMRGDYFIIMPWASGGTL